ncbi:hypothetical protein IB60_17250 [Brucella abortus LMN1]|nr:hypothetical protein IB60_17250 [Brucella abortus LMN1]
METYNFLADLLSTFRSMPDGIKALIIVSPHVVLLALVLRPLFRTREVHNVVNHGVPSDRPRPDGAARVASAADRRAAQ